MKDNSATLLAHTLTLKNEKNSYPKNKKNIADAPVTGAINRTKRNLTKTLVQTALPPDQPIFPTR